MHFISNVIYFFMNKEFIIFLDEPLSFRLKIKDFAHEHSSFESQMNSNFHSNQASKL